MRMNFEGRGGGLKRINQNHQFMKCNFQQGNTFCSVHATFFALSKRHCGWQSVHIVYNRLLFQNPVHYIDGCKKFCLIMKVRDHVGSLHIYKCSCGLQMIKKYFVVRNQKQLAAKVNRSSQNLLYSLLHCIMMLQGLQICQVDC